MENNKEEKELLRIIKVLSAINPKNWEYHEEKVPMHSSADFYIFETNSFYGKVELRKLEAVGDHLDFPFVQRSAGPRLIEFYSLKITDNTGNTTLNAHEEHRISKGLIESLYEKIKKN